MNPAPEPPANSKLPEPIRITAAPIVSGASRGRRIGIPTLNIDLSVIPKELQHGIYACWIRIGDKQYRGAMHYGPRPVFQDSETFEVHVLDAVLNESPETVDIDIVARIRDVQNLESIEALKKAIAADIEAVRAMLKP